MEPKNREPIDMESQNTLTASRETISVAQRRVIDLMQEMLQQQQETLVSSQDMLAAVRADPKHDLLHIRDLEGSIQEIEASILKAKKIIEEANSGLLESAPIIVDGRQGGDSR